MTSIGMTPANSFMAATSSLQRTIPKAPNTVSKAQEQSYFSKIDANKSGLLSLGELRNAVNKGFGAHSAMGQALNTLSNSSAFHKAAGAGGMLSQGELLKALSSMGYMA